MKEPFKKILNEIQIEEAHGGSGSRQLILSNDDSISEFLEAMTKGYLKVDAHFDWHSHEGLDEFFLVSRGTGRVEFRESETIGYKENELIYIPASIEHKIIATGNIDSEFFFVRIKT